MEKVITINGIEKLRGQLIPMDRYIELDTVIRDVIISDEFYGIEFQLPMGNTFKLFLNRNGLSTPFATEIDTHYWKLELGDGHPVNWLSKSDMESLPNFLDQLLMVVNNLFNDGRIS